MRLKGIRSLRELTRILDVDRRVRRLCLITDKEGGYTRSGLSRFTKRVGADRFQLIIEERAPEGLVWAPCEQREGSAERGGVRAAKCSLPRVEQEGGGERGSA